MMRFLFFRVLGCGLVWLLVAAADAGPFVAPEDRVPPFRRDLLPVSVNTISDLSKSLTLLARGGRADTAEKRRAVAQSLALALALDPENEAALDLARRLEKGEDADQPTAEELTRAKARIWQIHAWLGMEAAGESGNILAELLGDPLAVLDEGNPGAGEPGKGGEMWADWVAPLDEFKVEEVVNTEPEEKEEAMVENKDADEGVGRPEIKLNEGRVESVSFQRTGPDEPYVLAPVMFSMKADGAAGERFRVEIDSLSNNGSSGEKIGKAVNRALEKIHGALPAKGVVSISAEGLQKYSFRMNGMDASGAAFLLAESALSGKGVDTAVIGKINEKGELVLPDFFWRDLRAIWDGQGGRLVLPAEAYEYLVGVLVLEKPEFFLKYEVLLARDAEEFVQLASSEPAEEYAGIFAKFAEIRERAEGEFVWSFLANTFVRQRLEDLAEAAPYHASARLLAIQGAGERPRALSRKLLAGEIWRMIDPLEIKELYQIQTEGGVAGVQEMYEELREGLDALERYTDSQDKDLLSSGQALAATARDLVRAASKVNFEERMADTKEALEELISRKKALRTTLAEITGDPSGTLKVGE